KQHLRSLIPLLLLAVFLGTLSVLAQTENRPNIISILLDDTPLNQIAEQIDPSSPTYLPDFMPNLQGLIISRGLAFKNFYVTLSLCCPSRASMLRGQYPHNTGIVDNKSNGTNLN